MTTTILHRAPLFVASCIACMLATGCSLRYDFQDQCAVTQDCASLDGSGTFYTCNPETLECEVDSSIQCRADGDCDANQTCDTSTNQCEAMDPGDMGSDMTPDEDMGLEDMGPPDMPEDMGPSLACTANSYCADTFGETHLCGPQGECVDALSEDCARFEYGVSGSARDNVVLVGTLLPLSPPYTDTIGIPFENSASMAVDIFNDEGGLPGGRKIAWISCDTKGNSDVATRAADHIVNTLGAPAVVGPLLSDPFISVASNVTNPAGAFAITPTATSPAVANQRTAEKLVWRNIASDVFQGSAFIKRIEDLKDQGITKVLIFYKGDKYGEDLQQLILPALRDEVLTPEDVQVVRYRDPVEIGGTLADIQSEYGMNAGQVLAGGFRAQAVLFIGQSEAVIMAGAYLTALLTIDMNNAVLPRMIFSHGATVALPQFPPAIMPEMLRPSITALLEGIAPNIFEPTSDRYLNYALAYNTRFSNTDPALASTTTFDALMLTMLGMSRVPDDQPVTGQDISDAIPFMVDTSAEANEITFFVNPSYVGSIRNALADGETVDVVGVSGEMDFDVETGEVYQRYFGWSVVSSATSSTGYAIEPARRIEFTNAPSAEEGQWEDLP